MTDDNTGDSQDRRTMTGAFSSWGDDSKPLAEGPHLRELGRYTDLELIGHGGMGSVYKAWDPKLSRTVALKVLARHDAQARARFMREARSQAQISHRNVCEIFEVGEVEQMPFIAMRHIPGFSLAALQDELVLTEKVRVVRDVARAIHAAHERGLIHRDVKPSNIMLEETEGGIVQPVVVDFGLSKPVIGDEEPYSGDERSFPTGGNADAPDLTREGDVAGTPAYMAPEQALGLVDRLDARTDVYALGCTLYQALAGRPPLVANSAMSLLLMATSQAPPPLKSLNPKVPPDLQAIVDRCLEKDPGDRYQTAAELADDLERMLDRQPVEAYGGGVMYRVERWIRRQPVLVGLLAVLVIGAAAATVSWVHSRWEIRRQTEMAQRFGQEVSLLESFLWKVRSLPPHDTAKHSRVVRERIDRLEKRLAESGQAGLGPGNFAIGSALRALGEDEAARQHLEKAWQSGYHEPEVAYELGLVLSRLYQQSLMRLETIAETEVRETERLRLERDLRDPARQFLDLSEGATLEAPELVSGLIALCEGRYEEAIAAARESFGKKPWIYEAKLLEGGALASQALDAAMGGAELDFREARAAFTEAVEVAPSDPQCRLQIAGLGLRSIGRANDVEHRKVGEKELATAIGDAEMATRVASDFSAAHSLLAEVLTAAAMNGRAFESGEPNKLFDRALAEAELALDLDPDDAAVLAAAGRVRAWRAVDAMRWGGVDDESLETLLENAIKNLQSAVERRSTYDNLNVLGVAARRRGLWRGMRGQDCAEDFETAAMSFKAATERLPEGIHALHNLASVLHAQAYFAAPELEERVDLLKQSVAAYGRLLDRHPDDAEVCYSMGQAEADLASAVEEQGGDPTPLYERSIGSFERAVELFPGFSQAQRAAGYGWVLKGEYLLRHGSDPTASLNRAETWLEAACGHEGFASPWVTLGGLHRVRAEHRILTGGDPIPDIAASIAAFDQSLEIRSGRPDVYVGRAQTVLLRAEYQLDNNIDPMSALERARDDLGAALGVNPKQWQAEALRAEAAVLEMRWIQKGEGEVGELIGVAKAALEAEAANNPSDRLRLLVAGELALCCARRSVAEGLSAEEDVQRGLEALAEALAADPSSAESHVLKGQLHLWAVEHGVGDRALHVEQAVAHLTTGLEINNFLEDQVSEDLQRARSRSKA